MQVLHLNNGDTINDKLSNPASVITRWVDDKLPLEQVIEQAYLSALTRFPTDDERGKLQKLVAEADAAEVSRRETYEDLLWSLMTSPEFLFTH